MNGTTAGAGWMLALLADLVVAAEGARWTHVFARRGMVPHAGDPFFLPRVLPFHRLNEAALLPDSITSETLAEWGAVNRLVPAEQVESTAAELAERLAAGPTRSLGLTKRLYRRSLVSDMATAFAEEAAATALVTQTRDRIEGVEVAHRGPATRLHRHLTPVALLDGLRVVEVALLAPNMLGMHLADLGADVIKVEDPGRGDYTRSVGAAKRGGLSFLHLRWNRGKRSIVARPALARRVPRCSATWSRRARS